MKLLWIALLAGCGERNAAEPSHPTADDAARATPDAGVVNARCTVTGKARHVPKLTGEMKLLDVLWETEADAACPTGTRDVLAVVAAGQLPVGEFYSSIVVGDICPTFTSRGGQIRIRFHQYIPSDGDEIVFTAGTDAPKQCKRFDRPLDDPWALLDGNCASASPVVTPTDYTVRVRVRAPSPAHVRSTALFMADEPNIIGEVAGGTVLHAQGPLKHADFGGGIGYAVMVRDRAGRRCRGYVSASVIDVTAP